MEITKLRSTNRGIQGTIANAKHHAQALLPFIEALEVLLPTLHFKTWKQGHNIHQFINHDGRKFELVPIVREGESYVGIRLRLHVTRSLRHTLFDATDVSKIPDLVNLMRLMAQPIQPDIRLGGGVKK